MTTIEQIVHEVSQLDAEQKRQVLHQLGLPGLNERTFPLIEKTPQVSGEKACFIRSRIPVWVVERMRQLGTSDSMILANFPTLRPIDLDQATQYAATFSDEITAAIQTNE